MDTPEKNYPRRAPRDDKDYRNNDDRLDEEDAEPVTARGGIGTPILIGLAAGVLSAAEGVGQTLLNGGAYRQANINPNDMSLNYLIVGLYCLNIIVALLLCFGAGWLTGKRTLKRSYGFLAGVVATVVFFAGNFLVTNIPGYPSKIVGSGLIQAPSVAMTIVTFLIALLIQGMVFGLISLWGASIATRPAVVYEDEE